MSDPITNISFGQRVAAFASSVGNTTVEWAGRSVTWIKDAAVAIWGAIVSVVAAVWHAIASAVCCTGTWLLANSWQAAIVVVVGVGIGIALTTLYNRYVGEAAEGDEDEDVENNPELAEVQAQNLALRNLLQGVLVHPDQALNGQAELLQHLQEALAPAAEQPDEDVDGVDDEPPVHVDAGQGAAQGPGQAGDQPAGDPLAANDA